MLKYIIIVLGDNSVSFCHYRGNSNTNLMPLQTLQEGIIFAMKHNLSIQYILPKEKLSLEYLNLMSTMEHINIGTLEQEDNVDIIVLDGLHVLQNHVLRPDKKYILKINIENFLSEYKKLKDVFTQNIHLNIVFTDTENFHETMIDSYSFALEDLGMHIIDNIQKGYDITTNLLTDRIVLNEMNNCGAGDSCITLAPNGNFYICPGFYYENIAYGNVGNLIDGINIKNKKLYTLEGAPLCKQCDAYHCKRCILLNKKLTLEVNVPSRQQCVMAHVERNTSQKILEKLHQLGVLPEKTIPIIDYLDPFDKIKLS